jgi:regulator of protease activity HflC (stomatin/prohibitin superfamily)
MIITGFELVALTIVVLVFLTLMMGVRTIPQGYNFTVERFGKYSTTLRPGLALIVPWIDRIGRKMNMMEQVIDVPSQEVITRDNATVTVDGVVFFQVLDAARASYEVSNLEQALLNLVMTNIRTVMGSMDLDMLLSHRDEINQRLLNVVDQAVEPWGVKAARIEIKDIVPPRDLVESMGRQMKAEREKRANILEAEGMRASEILRAEGRKQAVVLDAEGRKEAAFRDAEARERSAQAEAVATRAVSEAIASGDIAALNYFVAEKYVRALDSFAKAPNQKTFILPMDMAGIAGAIGGIAEIARSALTESARDDSQRPRATTPPAGRAVTAPPPAPSSATTPSGQPPASGPWGGGSQTQG